MTRWPQETLARIAATDDLHIAPYRANGEPGTPTWIWSVVVDGDLYVRAYNGTRSSWYRSAKEHGAGIITAAGASRSVSFELVDPSDATLMTAIDRAYQVKYADSPYLAPMVSADARAATVRIHARPDGDARD